MIAQIHNTFSDGGSKKIVSPCMWGNHDRDCSE